IKGFINTAAIMAGEPTNAASWSHDFLGLCIVAAMIVFTIIFGIRRLDPSERHPGMMVAVTFEAVLKLVAFCAVGIFVTYGLHNGFGDIFGRLVTTVPKTYGFMGKTTTPNFLTWI